MSFDFSCQDDGNLFMSLKGLVNKNQGFFKTAKQAQFLFKQYTAGNIHTPDEAMRYFGVPLIDGQVLVTATAHTRWADYGSRSVIPVIFAFVVDKLGVVALYKVSGRGNLRDGWGPDPSKTKETWSRPADAVCPFTLPSAEEIAAIKSEEPVSNWLGYPGDKVETTLTLIRSRHIGSGQFGDMFLSVFKDSGGNIVNIWRHFNLQDGEVIKVKGTIKTTDDYKGTKQTTLTRVKVL